jgi:predicted acyltransferase
VLLAAFIYLVDELGYKRLVRPFAIIGMNAITIYMLSELLAIALGAIHWRAAAGTISLGSWLFEHCFAPLASPYNAALLWALAFVLLMYLAAYAMYRRKLFVRI